MYSLQWRHNAHSGVSNHRPLECVFNRVGPVTRKPFPFDNAVMYYSEGVCYISLRNVCADFETDRFVGWIFLKAVVWNKKVSLKSKDLRRQFLFRVTALRNIQPTHWVQDERQSRGHYVDKLLGHSSCNLDAMLINRPLYLIPDLYMTCPFKIE